MIDRVCGCFNAHPGCDSLFLTLQQYWYQNTFFKKKKRKENLYLKKLVDFTSLSWRPDWEKCIPDFTMQWKSLCQLLFSVSEHSLYI